VGKVEEILDEYCEGTATLTATAEGLKYGLANGLAVEEDVRGAIDRLVGDGRLAAQSAAKLLVMLAVPTPVEADGRTVFRASPETGRGREDDVSCLLCHGEVGAAQRSGLVDVA